jgi:hypothetical protein
MGKRVLPLLLLIALTILFRLPPILNANAINSDAAVVALQAGHILQGEWSSSLWGIGYQSSFDALMTALGFALAGESARTVILVQTCGYLFLVFFSYQTLQHLGSLKAAILNLPLVFAPIALSIPLLYAGRQWCITVLVGSICCLDRAGTSRFSTLFYALGVSTALLALHLDRFALIFMPGILFLIVTSLWDGGASKRLVLQRIGACLFGALIGFLSYYLVHATDEPVSQMALGLVYLPKNLHLLWDSCLPYLLSYKVFIPGGDLYPDLWHPPGAFLGIQRLGAVVLIALLAFGGVSIAIARIPWPIRRLGVMGLIVCACSLGAFSLSVMPVDMWSVRYLSPILWISPFALAPAAFLLRGRSLALLLGPYLLSAAVAGWLSWGDSTRAILPTLTARGKAAEERELGAYLRGKGIEAGAAQYWLAYRLTFLFHEKPVVIPLNPGEDRYEPYRRKFAMAPIKVYIFHPSEPRAIPEPYEASFRRTGVHFERTVVSGFTLLIVRGR